MIDRARRSLDQLESQSNRAQSVEADAAATDSQTVVIRIVVPVLADGSIERGTEMPFLTRVACSSASQNLLSSSPLSPLAMDSSSDAVLVWMLRVCVAMTFFGHGYLATKTQAGWYAYLAVAGIGRRVGAPLMRIIGVLDIALAVAVALLHPVPVVHAWCFVWGLATAAMRPLAGESIHQFIERSGNFLPALALLWIECQSKPGSFEYHLMLSGVAIAGMILVSLFLRVTGLLADLPSSKGKMDQ